MNKKGLLGLIVILLIILVVGFFFFVKWINKGIDTFEAPECKVDTDCVPASCCHAATCTAIAKGPSCEGTFCTANCEPDTMDCGQGSCDCVEGKCIVNFVQ